MLKHSGGSIVLMSKEKKFCWHMDSVCEQEAADSFGIPSQFHLFPLSNSDGGTATFSGCANDLEENLLSQILAMVLFLDIRLTIIIGMRERDGNGN